MQHNEFALRIRYLIFSLLTAVALIILASSYSERVLRVSLLPDESPSVQRRKLRPLTDYLVDKIGIRMEFRPMNSGNALIESFAYHELDLVWIDGNYLARAKSRSKEQVIPLVQRVAEESTGLEFTTTTGIDDHIWSVRADMDAELRQKLTEAFLMLNKSNARDREILALQRASRFMPATVTPFRLSTEAPVIN